MGKWFWLVLVGAVGLMIGLFILLDDGNSGSNISSNSETSRVVEGDHYRGTGEASVTLVEYGDFQCPACGAFYPQVKQLEEEYGDQVDIVYRHFPLTNIHPKAMAAHRAAQAAGNQGKFFEMHDILYERQSLWAQQENVGEIFERYADELGLDHDQFVADVQSEETFNFISAQIQSGTELGATGTPTLFVNGERINTPRSYEELKGIIDDALAKAQDS